MNNKTNGTITTATIKAITEGLIMGYSKKKADNSHLMKLKK